MKVAFVSQPWASVRPPSESLAIWTVEVARRLASECEITVYARGDPADSGPDDGVDYRFVRATNDWRLLGVLEPTRRRWPRRRPLFTSPLYHASYWRTVASDVRKRGFDVVHLHNFSQAARPLAHAGRAATVLHMHCEWLNQLDRRMIGRRLASVALVAGCSDYVSGRVREAFPRTRTATLYNGVDARAFAQRDAGDAARILYVGRVSPEKGVHVLVNAFEEVLARRTDATLEVVGPEGVVPLEMGPRIDATPRVRALERFYAAPYADSLRRALSERARARVRFAGALPHADLPSRYAAAAVLAAPSVWNEPFGMPVVEAMAAGIPVTATRVGGIPETVLDGETGLLVPPDDAPALACALLRLLDDRPLARRLGEAGRRRARERFSWDAVAERALRLYRELTAPRAAS